MCRSGGYATVSNLDHHVHHLEVVLELPLRFGDVPRVPGRICQQQGIIRYDIKNERNLLTGITGTHAQHTLALWFSPTLMKHDTREHRAAK